MPRPIAALLLVVGLGMVPAGCIENGRPDPAALLIENDRTAEVEVGDIVDIRLAENPSIGDDWQVVEEPDDEVATLSEEGFAPDEPQMAGSGGIRLFSYRATGVGTTEVVIYNCSRCVDGRAGEPGRGEELTFRIEVAAD